MCWEEREPSGKIPGPRNILPPFSSLSDRAENYARALEKSARASADRRPFCCPFSSCSTLKIFQPEQRWNENDARARACAYVHLCAPNGCRALAGFAYRPVLVELPVKRALLPQGRVITQNKVDKTIFEGVVSIVSIFLWNRDNHCCIAIGQKMPKDF